MLGEGERDGEGLEAGRWEAVAAKLHIRERCGPAIIYGEQPVSGAVGLGIGRARVAAAAGCDHYDRLVVADHAARARVAQAPRPRHAHMRESANVVLVACEDGPIHADDDVVADLKDEGVDAKIKLQTSDRYRRHMAAIAERSEKPASFDDDEEYALIVESNEILVKMDAELHEVHAYVNDLYGKKFPELETLVPSKLEYLRVVAQMRNEMDMTQVDFCAEIKFWAPYAIDATSTWVVSTRRGRGWSFFRF